MLIGEHFPMKKDKKYASFFKTIVGYSSIMFHMPKKYAKETCRLMNLQNETKNYLRDLLKEDEMYFNVIIIKQMNGLFSRKYIGIISTGHGGINIPLGSYSADDISCFVKGIIQFFFNQNLEIGKLDNRPTYLN